LWRFSRIWLYGLGGIFLSLWGLFASRAGGFDHVQAFLLALFITGSLAFVAGMGRVLRPEEDKRKLFLALWVFTGLLELIVVMPWTAGRYLLCVLPAIAWCFSLMLAELRSPALRRGIIAVT